MILAVCPNTQATFQTEIQWNVERANITWYLRTWVRLYRTNIVYEIESTFHNVRLKSAYHYHIKQVNDHKSIFNLNIEYPTQMAMKPEVYGNYILPYIHYYLEREEKIPWIQQLIRTYAQSLTLQEREKLAHTL